MRILILAGVAAAALTLTACNREEPADIAAVAEDATPTSDTGTMASGSSGSAGSSTISSGSGYASSGGGAPGSAGPAPAQGSMPAQEPTPAPVSEATRQGAKEKAENTNLHPPTN